MWSVHLVLLTIAVFFILPAQNAPTSEDASSRDKRESPPFTFDIPNFIKEFMNRNSEMQLVKDIKEMKKSNKTLVMVQGLIKQSEKHINEIREGIEKIGKDVLTLITDKQKMFERDINSLALLLSENLDLLTKDELSNPEKHRRQEVVDQMLNKNRGIENTLRQLHLTFIGVTSFDGVSILETYWNQIMAGRKRENFQVVPSMRDDTLAFAEYLMQLQQKGFSIWHTAIAARHENKTTVEEMQERMHEHYAQRLKEQEVFLTKIFAPCPEIKLEDFPNRLKSLACDDGPNFGSICRQRCAGTCLQQRITFDKYFWPHMGYPPLQCLLFGKWSKNVGSETKYECTFCNVQGGVRNEAFPRLCYKDGGGEKCEGITPRGVGLKSGKKCTSACNGKREKSFVVSLSPEVKKYRYVKYWCEVRGGWDYCLPNNILKNELSETHGITMSGNKCSGKCSTSSWGWFKCKSETGKTEYCS